MSQNKSQPSHRVSVPAKSALKSSKLKPQPSSSNNHASSSKSKGSITLQAGTGLKNKQKEVRKRKAREESDEEEDEDVDMDAGDEDGSVEDDDEEEEDTDEEIEGMKREGKKSKKNTKKRKAPTTTDTFADALASLLTESSEPPAKKTKLSKPTTSATSTSTSTDKNPILSLSAPSSLPPSTQAIRLERKAKAQLRKDKEEKRDRARVKDVVEGWGPRTVTLGVSSRIKSEEGGEVVEVMAPGGQEWERGLRKVAQRGVIKLFNAILQASASRAPVKVSDTLNSSHKDRKGKKAEKDNELGRGSKKEVLTKEGFLGMIKGT